MAYHVDINGPVGLARRLGYRHEGELDLDNGVPFDIYELFEMTVGRDYGEDIANDELLILDIAAAYEEAAKA